MRRARPALIAGATALALGAGPAASAATGFDWDELGARFCEVSTSGSLAEMRPLLTDALVQEITFAFARAGEAPPPTLFQTYSDPVPVCRATTRNAALVEIVRSGARGTPAWTEYLVVVPETDGTTRIDDVLFATRRSDTLRARLKALAGGG
ncbi:hypothetical protein [Amaricoccus sp.]|uniref:hypothetical protein n=1 Tax=Amaricoccus sp. TaxID=1872485 RepID=UPI001B64A28E|nr:hypothetical protein [Amaricoccus sp.]MBP7243343.1 hypothetical protein [Amaricoccus sp.]